jgi:hypothetical protein
MRLLRTRPPAVVEALAVALLAAALIWPLFKLKYAGRWESIESTFISDARLLSENWPHPLWQPLWYCGTRFDYVYPPALRYGTAALARTFSLLPARAYHLYTALFYVLGIGGVFLLVRYLAGSRASAWLAATAAALVSPSFLLIADVRNDAWLLMPQRIGVLVRYGEGPHITAVALLGFALLFLYRALEAWRPASFAAAAVFCAAVVSNNFYGATSLAIFAAVMGWSVWITHRDNRAWLRLAGIAALAYGLTAFWLVPSFVTITVRNLRFVADEGNLWSKWVGLAVVVGFVRLTDRLARGRRELGYLVFVSGATLFFGLSVLGRYYFNFLVVGVPMRLVPELDLCFILLGAELARRAWNSTGRMLWVRRAAVALILVAGLGSARHYVRHAWQIFPRDPEPQKRVEYQVTNWLHTYYPDARVYAPGSIRFWYDAWFSLAQLGGGSEQGLLNPMTAYAQWHITNGEGLEQALLWLKALGTDLVIVSGPNSRQSYKDFPQPSRFTPLLKVYDYQDDVIYRVPRRYPGLARVVDKARLTALPALIDREPLIGELRQYVDVLEKGPEAPPDTHWLSNDELEVRGITGPGEAMAVAVSYDTPWRAYDAAGHALAVHPDFLGNLWIDTPPGDHIVRLRFELPFENMAGRAITLLALAATAWLFARALLAARRV